MPQHEGSLLLVRYLDIMVLGASHYTDVAVGRVGVINRQLHDGGLVTTRQLTHRLVPSAHVHLTTVRLGTV